MVELVLEEQVDSGDLAADGDDPAEHGEKAEARRGGLLVLRCLPIPGNVCGGGRRCDDGFIFFISGPKSMLLLSLPWRTEAAVVEGSVENNIGRSELRPDRWLEIETAGP
jgi:hypothetical protein